MSGWRLTVRHGPRVERERFDALDDAIAALGREAEAIRAEGPLSELSMLRTYESSERVAGRVELSTGGWLRGRAAGIDVMGDGTLVPFAGGLRRRGLESGREETPVESVRRELE